MFRLWLTAVVALIVATNFPLTAAAVPLACLSDQTLSDYIALGVDGCTIGDKAFSNFNLVLGPGTGATTVPTAAQIEVTPVDEPLNPGLTFSGNFKSPPAAGPFFYSYRLSFTVTVRPGGDPIDDASLEFANPTATGNANSTISEQLCLGGLFESKGICNPGIPQAALDVRDNTGQPNQTFDIVSFDPVSTVDVQKLIVVSQGTPDQPGSASFTALTEQFSEVGEPSSLLLLASALLGLLISVTNPALRFDHI